MLVLLGLALIIWGIATSNILLLLVGVVLCFFGASSDGGDGGRFAG